MAKNLINYIFELSFDKIKGDFFPLIDKNGDILLKEIIKNYLLKILFLNQKFAFYLELKKNTSLANLFISDWINNTNVSNLKYINLVGIENFLKLYNINSLSNLNISQYRNPNELKPIIQTISPLILSILSLKINNNDLSENEFYSWLKTQSDTIKLVINNKNNSIIDTNNDFENDFLIENNVQSLDLNVPLKKNKLLENNQNENTENKNYVNDLIQNINSEIESDNKFETEVKSTSENKNYVNDLIQNKIREIVSDDKFEKEVKSTSENINYVNDLIQNKNREIVSDDKFETEVKSTSENINYVNDLIQNINSEIEFEDKFETEVKSTSENKNYVNDLIQNQNSEIESDDEFESEVKSTTENKNYVNDLIQNQNSEIESDDEFESEKSKTTFLKIFSLISLITLLVLGFWFFQSGLFMKNYKQILPKSWQNILTSDIQKDNLVERNNLIINISKTTLDSTTVQINNSKKSFFKNQLAYKFLDTSLPHSLHSVNIEPSKIVELESVSELLNMNENLKLSVNYFYKDSNILKQNTLKDKTIFEEYLKKNKGQIKLNFNLDSNQKNTFINFKIINN